MKLLQLIKNKFINKKEIADIKIATKPEKYSGLESINNTEGTGGSGGGGSGGTGIPFCRTCGIQYSINYVSKCNC